MTRAVTIALAVALVAGLCLGQTRVADPNCLPTVSLDPNTLPYVIDVLRVRGALLGSRTQYVGQGGGMTGHCCDPDGDPVAVQAAGGLPPGLTLTQTDPNGTYTINGIPTTKGTYYIYVRATDNPVVASQSLSAEATIVWYVLPANQPPVIRGCGSEYAR